MWPEESSLLQSLGAMAAIRGDATTAPASVYVPDAAASEYIPDEEAERRDAALARAVNGMALEYEGVAPAAEWGRQFEDDEWEDWPSPAAAPPGEAAAAAAPQPPDRSADPNSAYARAAAAQAAREKAKAEQLTNSAMRNRAAAAQAAAAADAVVAALPSRPAS